MRKYMPPELHAWERGVVSRIGVKTLWRAALLAARWANHVLRLASAHIYFFPSFLINSSSLAIIGSHSCALLQPLAIRISRCYRWITLVSIFLNIFRVTLQKMPQGGSWGKSSRWKKVATPTRGWVRLKKKRRMVITKRGSMGWEGVVSCWCSSRFGVKNRNGSKLRIGRFHGAWSLALYHGWSWYSAGLVTVDACWLFLRTWTRLA